MVGLALAGLDKIGQIRRGSVATGNGPPPEPLLTPWLIDEAGPAFAVSADGTTVTHDRKGFDVAVGDKVMRSGVHRFTYKVIKSRNGKGHNIYLGVADADVARVQPMAEDGGSTTRRAGQANRNGAPFKFRSGQMGKAWGLHPFDGTVYYSDDGYQRGEKAWLPKAKDAKGLTVQQVAQLQHAHARGKADGWEILCVVDMDQKKLSFSVNGGEEIDSRVELPAGVVPYVFFDWKDDAIAIISGIDATMRQPAIVREPGGSDPLKSARGQISARGPAPPPVSLGTPATATPATTAEVSSPDRAMARKVGNDDARLQRALTVLLLASKENASVVSDVVPGFDSQACKTRETLLAEIERLGETIDSLLSEDVRA